MCIITFSTKRKYTLEQSTQNIGDPDHFEEVSYTPFIGGMENTLELFCLAN